MYTNKDVFIFSAIAFVGRSRLTLAEFADCIGVIGSDHGHDYYAGFAAELTSIMNTTRKQPVTNCAEYFVESVVAHTMHFGNRNWEVRRMAAKLAPGAEKSPNSAEFITGCVAANRVFVRLLHDVGVVGVDSQVRTRLYKLFVAATLIAREKIVNASKFAYAARPY